jgi:hypothetical protein
MCNVATDVDNTTAKRPTAEIPASKGRIAQNSELTLRTFGLLLAQLAVTPGQTSEYTNSDTSERTSQPG